MSALNNAAAGASVGGAIGSVVPALGTAMGAGVGAVGSLLYDGAKAIFSPNSEKATSPSELLNGHYVNLGKVGNKKESRAMDAQSRLAALQQYYAQQNNQQDVENQMMLTRSAAELEAQGKRAAGLSTAGDFNGESVTSPTINSPSLPSAPAVDDTPSEMDTLNFAKDVSSLLSQLKLNDSAARKNDSESDLNDIDKLSRYDKNIADLDSQLQQNKISRVEYKRLKTALEYERNSLSDNIEKNRQERLQSEYETKIKEQQEIYQKKQNELFDISKKLTKEQLKQAEFITSHQLQRYNVEIQEAMSRVNLNKASASAAYSQAALAAQQKLYTAALTALEDAKVPLAPQLATSIAQLASADADVKTFQQQLLENQIPESENKRDYHKSPIGQTFDMLLEPLHFVLSSTSLLGK